MKNLLSSGILACLVFVLASVSYADGLVDADPGHAGNPISLVSGVETLKRKDLTIGNTFPIDLLLKIYIPPSITQSKEVFYEAILNFTFTKSKVLERVVNARDKSASPMITKY